MGPRVHVVLLAALAAGSAGCQLVFGLDGYAPEEGATTTCAPLTKAAGASGPGLCGVRHIPNIGPTITNPSPAAACEGSDCTLVYGDGVNVVCSTCPNLPGGDCEPPAILTGLPNQIRSPYIRDGRSEIWVAGVLPDDDDHDIHFASLDGCTPGVFDYVLPEAMEPEAVSSPDDELQPAISPNGKVLFFTRCDGDGDGDPPACRLHVARRSMDGGRFDEEQAVDGLRFEVPPEAKDIHPRPLWGTDGESVEVLYFASTRAATTPTGSDDQLDVFVARRPAGSTWDAQFDPPELVGSLSTQLTDLTPVPLSPSFWLWSRNLEAGGADFYGIDVGCGARFGPLDAEPFLEVNTAVNDERAPAIADDGALLLARTEPGMTSTLFKTEGPVDAWGAPSPGFAPDVAHTAGAHDKDPAPLPDGRLIFASDRGGGVFKLWIAAEGEAPVRVTTDEGPRVEESPFVDSDGTLWFAWGSEGDPLETVIAYAVPDGSGRWLAPTEEPAFAHQPGRSDRGPRLSADRRTLIFLSARDGGFAPESSDPASPFAPTPWAVTRERADAPWGEPFVLHELGSVNGVADPWLSPNGCTITLASRGRDTGFRWDLRRSARLGGAAE